MEPTENRLNIISSHARDIHTKNQGIVFFQKNKSIQINLLQGKYIY